MREGRGPTEAESGKRGRKAKAPCGLFEFDSCLSIPLCFSACVFCDLLYPAPLSLTVTPRVPYGTSCGAAVVCRPCALEPGGRPWGARPVARGVRAGAAGVVVLRYTRSRPVSQSLRPIPLAKPLGPVQLTRTHVHTCNTSTDSSLYSWPLASIDICGRAVVLSPLRMQASPSGIKRTNERYEPLSRTERRAVSGVRDTILTENAFLCSLASHALVSALAFFSPTKTNDTSIPPWFSTLIPGRALCLFICAKRRMPARK